MSEFLGVIKGQRQVTEGEIADLSAEWRAANELIKGLQKSESGLADNVVSSPLDKTLELLVRKVNENPIFRETFSVVPPVIAMVELDRLVVFQKFINLGYVEKIKECLGQNPGLEDIFHAAIPFLGESNIPEAQIESAFVSDNAYVFMSPSADLRVLDARVLEPEQLSLDGLRGHLRASVALSLGTGSNCLSAIRLNNRLILNNGSHRAYALRSLGVTHVPCVIQNVTRNDELPLVATPEFLSNISEYISNPRPPILKDYFNDDLVKILKVKRKNRQIKVSFKVEVMDVPAI